jgi:hypothetical protein
MLYNEYFSDDPTYNAKDFRRPYRMSKDMFMKIVYVVRDYDDYLELKRDCTRTVVSHQLQCGCLHMRLLEMQKMSIYALASQRSSSPCKSSAGQWWKFLATLFSRAK